MTHPMFYSRAGGTQDLRVVILFILFFVVSSGKAVQKWKSSDASISPLSYLRKVILLSICDESKRNAALLVPLSSSLLLATSSKVGCDFTAL